MVVEELDGIIERHCKTLGLQVEGKNLFPPLGEFSQKTVAKAFGLPARSRYCPLTPPFPPVRPMMCAGCPHRGMYLYPGEE